MALIAASAVFLNWLIVSACAGRSFFATPGEFTWEVPACTTTVNVLVVGGGGGGGAQCPEPSGGGHFSTGGGGGAGGFLCVSNFQVTPLETVNVIVGANGLLGDIGDCDWGEGREPTSGGNSSFSSLVAVGGGGASTRSLGLPGGSGGGGGDGNAGGLNVPGQGFPGGSPVQCDGTGYMGCGGGGGGAGGPGAQGTTAGVLPAPGLSCAPATGTDINFSLGGGTTGSSPTAFGSGGNGNGGASDGYDGVSGAVIISWQDCPSPSLSATSSASPSATESASASPTSTASASSTGSATATQTAIAGNASLEPNIVPPLTISIGVLSALLAVSIGINAFYLLRRQRQLGSGNFELAAGELQSVNHTEPLLFSNETQYVGAL